MDSLIKHGKVIRPWLGILGVGINEQIAQYYKLPADKGILVTRVFENSPAAGAGIVPGDLIVEADHKGIKDMSELTHELREKKVGDSMQIKVKRGPQTGEMDMKLAESPS